MVALEDVVMLSADIGKEWNEDSLGASVGCLLGENHEWERTIC
jgi:hypothetical protein